ncbi:MAG: SulP family inorganic anion transporter [Candidatus Dormiibacterota bacterium]
MRRWWIPPTLRGYRASWLLADALAGLTLVAVVLPSQMATARLADLSVVAGLYAFVAGSLLYALIGTDRHLSVGADSASTAWSSLWPLSPSWWWLWWASSRVCCWP